MTPIQSTIPFHQTTLEEASEIVQKRYPDITPSVKERGIITLRTWTNSTHHFQVRDIIGQALESREIPL